jgi:hypothetical protein
MHILSPIGSTARIRWSRLAILYLLVNVFHILLWDTKFWDDWHQYEDIKNLESIERACPIDRCGKVPFTYLWEQPLLGIGEWTLRLAVVLAFAVSGWMVWLILGRLKCLSEFHRSMVTVFFLLVPVNGARVSFVTARASFMLTLFLIGLLLLSSRRIFQLIVGGALITFSMFQPSIQFFSVVIPIFLVGMDLGSGSKITRRTFVVSAIAGVVAISQRYVTPDLLIQANVVAEPVGYNAIQPMFLIRAVLVCGALSAPLAFELVRWGLDGFDSKPRVSLLRMGLFVLAVGTFPYMSVGHFPNLSDWVVVFLPDNSDWTSRYQLLQGPGYALILAGLAEYVAERWKVTYFHMVVAATVALGFTIFSTYYVDSLKQRDVIRQVSRQSANFSDVVFVEVVDNATDVNARGRTLRTYEWEGIFETALSREVIIWERNEYKPEIGCVDEKIGERVIIRKTSGRMRAILTRHEIVKIEIDDLVACK